MNKELREDLEHLIICNDKTITQDLRDDVKMTLDYIDELENKIDKAIEYIKTFIEIDEETGTYSMPYTFDGANLYHLLKILKGVDNE